MRQTNLDIRPYSEDWSKLRYLVLVSDTDITGASESFRWTQYYESLRNAKKYFNQCNSVRDDVSARVTLLCAIDYQKKQLELVNPVRDGSPIQIKLEANGSDWGEYWYDITSFEVLGSRDEFKKPEHGTIQGVVLHSNRITR
jgi:hypothetical protein